MSVTEKTCIKILMHVINYAANERLKFDNEYKNKISNLNENIQWKRDDIEYQTEIKDGVITGAEGSHSNPTIAFEMNDLATALELLTGKIALDKVFDKVKISGDGTRIQNLVFVLDTVRDYIGDMTN